jgi:hypothetical protein
MECRTNAYYYLGHLSFWLNTPFMIWNRPHIEATINGPSSSHVILIENFGPLLDSTVINDIFGNACKPTTLLTSTSTTASTGTGTGTRTTTSPTARICIDGVGGYLRVGNLRHRNTQNRTAIINRITSVNECAELCSAQVMCEFFVYNRQNHACHLFPSTPLTRANNGFVAYDRFQSCKQTTVSTFTITTTTTVTSTASCEGLRKFNKIGNKRHKSGNEFIVSYAVASAKKCAAVCSSAVDCN